MFIISLFNSRLLVVRRLFFLYCLLQLVCIQSIAHQAPYSIVYLDVSPDRVGAELHIPLTELSLALGNKNISQDPETLIQNMGPQLKEYFLAHTHAYVKREQPWLIEIRNITVAKEEQVASAPPFWELKMQMIFLPQNNEHTRYFLFDYDAVVHQVVNHIVFVSIRNDWETGRKDSLTADANPMAIRISGDNKIHPLEISLEKGNNWKGAINMLELGMMHIKEGTDHLLFLLVLLLPSTLLAKNERWSGFGGVKHSIKKLLSITTAFTIGHSLTLLTGAWGWIQLPPRPVEILIAVSILVSAIHAFRPVFPGGEICVAGGFGLIHGLAFASIISNFNLSAGTLALSILGFNSGIELMQLLIVILIIPWLILLSPTKIYPYVRMAGAIVAAGAALAWIAERATGNGNMFTRLIERGIQYAPWGILILGIVSILFHVMNKNKITAP